MKRILTLTLNPALDKSIAVTKLEPEKKLRATDAKSEPGGGGINISRALHQLGATSTAVYLAGGYTGEYFQKLLEQQGITAVALPIANDTRENFVVLDETADKQYRFGMEGPQVTEKEWKQCLEYIKQQSNLDYIVSSGSLPPGVPAQFMSDLAQLAKEKNVRLVVDTSGEALKQAVKQGLYLIKPNLGELSALYGKEKLETGDIVPAARSIIEKGGCELVAVSMGADGAMLITATETFTAKPPKVEMQSTVGAGDSMVAGLLYALTQDWPLQEALYYGVAAGSAATMNKGTELCKKEDTERLFREMKQQ